MIDRQTRQKEEEGVRRMINGWYILWPLMPWTPQKKQYRFWGGCCGYIKLPERSLFPILLKSRGRECDFFYIHFSALLVIFPWQAVILQFKTNLLFKITIRLWKLEEHKFSTIGDSRIQSTGVRAGSRVSSDPAVETDLGDGNQVVQTIQVREGSQVLQSLGLHLQLDSFQARRV